MSRGLDIGTETIVVATPSGTTRRRNTVRELDDSNTGAGDSLTVRTGSGRHAIGEDTGDDADSTRSLIGGSEEDSVDADVITAGLEAVLLDTPDSQSGGAFEEGTRVGYVDRDTNVYTQLSRAGTALDVTVERIDPGMAVCYDVFGPSPSGLGIMISEGRAFGTLAVEGIPVSTACIDFESRWYDVTDSIGTVDDGGPRSTWASIQYGTLLEDLLAEVVAGSPHLGSPTAVAMGGDAAPITIDEHDIDAISEGLPVSISSVTIAETPEESPARGALVAVQAGDERPGHVPAFAATDGYASALADTGAVADAFSEGVDRDRQQLVPGAVTDDAGSESKQTRGQRHRARLASTLDRLVDRIHDDRATDHLAEVRDDVDVAIGDLEAELADLEQRTPPQEAVTDLQDSVAEIEQTVVGLEDDIADLRTAITGLDAASLDNPEVAEALGSVAVDALQDDIDAVEADLASRIEGVWDKIDDINDKLIDVSARVDDLPGVERDLESTNKSVERLAGETTDLRRSIGDLRGELEEIDQQAATTDDVRSIRNDFDRIAEDLDTLRSEFRNVDRVDPDSVDHLQRDLDALQETVLNHARRLEGVERTVSDLSDRIDRAYQDTAKAEALSSLQAEVSQIGQNASSAAETANNAAKATDSLESSVDTIQEDLDQVRTMVDSLAESSVTRSELEESRTDIQNRLADLEAEQQRLRQRLSTQGAGSRFTLQLIAAGLASVGGLGALFANEFGQPAFAIGFLVLVVGPAIWLWLSVSEL